MIDDFNFMKEALKEAKKSFYLNEVPVGAVLVLDGKIIARGHNLVETKQDAACHAEMICLRKGAAKLKNWRLLNTTLYCTLEPCAMCAGAMLLHRIKRLVWGAPDLRMGAHGSWINLLDASFPLHQIEVDQGVLEEESAKLLKGFFKNRR